MKISLIDYDVGNIFNLTRAFEYLGVQVNLTRDPREIRNSDKIILPGVGAFQTGMDSLKKFGLDQEVIAFQKSGKPLLGICLGMQLLFEKGYEDGEWAGLGIIEGEVKKFPEARAKEYTVPHMCWNKVNLSKSFDKNPAVQQLVKGVEKDPFFYFVHSYYVDTKPQNTVLSCSYANIDFAAGVRKDNVVGYQFHPERSGPSGLNLLKNFVDP